MFYNAAITSPNHFHFVNIAVNIILTLFKLKIIKAVAKEHSSATMLHRKLLKNLPSNIIVTATG